MMFTKTTISLFVAALIVVGGAAYLLRDQGPAISNVDGTGEIVFPNLEARTDNVDRVILTGPEGTVTLVKQDDGWVVAERGNFPADTTKVLDLVAGFAAAARAEAKTADQTYFDRLGLADRFVDVSLFAGSSELGKIKTGDQFLSPTGQGVMTFAFDEATQRAWTYSGLPEVSPEAAFWVSKNLLFLSDLRIKRLTVAIGDEAPWQIQRSDPLDNDFVMPGVASSVLNQQIMNTAGLAPTAITFNDVQNLDTAGLVQIATARYEAFDGLIVEMAFFDREGEILTTLEAIYDERVLSAPNTPNVLPDAPPDGVAEVNALNDLWQGKMFLIPINKLAEMLKFQREFLRSAAAN